MASSQSSIVLGVLWHSWVYSQYSGYHPEDSQPMIEQILVESSSRIFFGHRFECVNFRS